MRTDRQRGAALVIVLMLVATLSFIALAISERTVLAASRSVNARARGELLWIGFGAEALARAAIKAAVAAEEGGMTRDSHLFAAPVEFPFEGGSAVMVFRDRTRCFNLNSLVSGEDDMAGPNETSVAELKALFESAREVPNGGNALIDAVIDWIDPDSLQQPRGAEDGYYAGLPAPYRTGGARLADVSELRAMANANRALYQAVRPLLCALPNADPAPINVNMLTPDEAPLLAGLTGGSLSRSQAESVIRDRPPGGYDTLEQFWSHDAFAGAEIPEAVRARARLTSAYIEAYAVMNYGEAAANLSMLFEVSGNGAPRLLRRRIERFD